MYFNPLKTNGRLLYLKSQPVPHSKHFSSRLSKPTSLWCKWYKSLFFSDKYKRHKYSVGRSYNCCMLNLLVHHVTSSFKRLIHSYLFLILPSIVSRIKSCKHFSSRHPFLVVSHLPHRPWVHHPTNNDARFETVGSLHYVKSPILLLLLFITFKFIRNLSLYYSVRTFPDTLQTIPQRHHTPFLARSRSTYIHNHSTRDK